MFIGEVDISRFVVNGRMIPGCQLVIFSDLRTLRQGVGSRCFYLFFFLLFLLSDG